MNFELVQTIADQQITEDRLNLQLTRLKLMYDFVSALNAAQTLSEIYQIALDGLCSALRINKAIVMVESGQRLKYEASVGVSNTCSQSIEVFFDNCYGDRANPSEQLANLPITFPHSATLPSDRQLQDLFHQKNIGAWAIFPLDYELRHLGDIVACFDTPRQFTEEEVQLTQTIVTYIAIALTRKQAEQALKESQQFIQRIADTTPSILYIYDIEERRNIYCNQAMTHILGYTKSEFHDMGERLLGVLLHPDDLDKVNQYYSQLRTIKINQGINPELRLDQNADGLFLLEYRMRDIQGKWRWFYSQENIFLYDQNGYVKQVIGAASDITKLKEAENKLQSSLAEKEVLLREVHHRVKNNLSVIDSLLSMQTKYVKDAEALKSISDSQRRIHTMALIHEQLHQSQNFGKIDFHEYLQRLVNNLYSSNSDNINHVDLKIDLNPAVLDIDMATSIGLIVNELLTNAFKHAFPNQEQGLIAVTLYKSNGDRRLNLVISDDGVGIPAQINLQDTNSLGLRLVRILAQQLRANLKMSAAIGTSFHLTVDL
jgi:PAS domain S-box-containing protein